jgi:hypothetical protein
VAVADGRCGQRRLAAGTLTTGRLLWSASDGVTVTSTPVVTGRSLLRRNAATQSHLRLGRHRPGRRARLLSPRAKRGIAATRKNNSRTPRLRRGATTPAAGRRRGAPGGSVGAPT